MNQYILASLCTCTKRAMARKKRRFGRPYFYNPRHRLVKGIAEEFRITPNQARKELMEIAKELRGGWNV